MIELDSQFSNVEDESVRDELKMLYPSSPLERLFLVPLMSKGKKTGHYHLYEGGDVTLDVYPKGTPVVEEEENYVLPALYKMDANGTELIWKIWVSGNCVKKVWGDNGGKLQLHERSHVGVNEGKKNATTDREQAMREAERDWVKYLDKGYRPKSKNGKALCAKVLKEKKKQGNCNANIYTIIRGLDIGTKSEKAKAKSAAKKKNNGTLPDYEVKELPMHAQEYLPTEAKCLKYFDFKKGVWVQRKYDGIRAHVRLVEKNGSKHVILTTRKGKQFVWLKGLREQFLAFFEGYEDVIFDCELYADVIYDEDWNEYPLDKRFDTISSACRVVRGTPHPQEDQICAHIFDIADETLDQDERFAKLDEIFAQDTSGTPNILRVESRLIHDASEVKKCLDEFAAEDYEGVIIRSRDLMYESGKRSLKMRKYKNFQDKEYPIIGVELDKGLTAKDFVWLCEGVDKNGKKNKFRAKPTGTEAQRIEFYTNYAEYIGFLLTCRFQELTALQVPRFSRGVALRETDSETYIFRYEKKVTKAKKAKAKVAKTKVAKAKKTK